MEKIGPHRLLELYPDSVATSRGNDWGATKNFCLGTTRAQTRSEIIHPQWGKGNLRCDLRGEPPKVGCERLCLRAG
jgi:hypothetical protein